MVGVHCFRTSCARSINASMHVTGLRTCFCGSNMFVQIFEFKVSIKTETLNSKMVGVTGFEPTTPTSRTWCSTRLSYTPTV